MRFVKCMACCRICEFRDYNRGDTIRLWNMRRSACSCGDAKVDIDLRPGWNGKSLHYVG